MVPMRLFARAAHAGRPLLLAVCIATLGMPTIAAADFSADVRGTATNGNSLINTNVQETLSAGGTGVASVVGTVETDDRVVNRFFGTILAGSSGVASASLAQGTLKATATSHAVRPPFDDYIPNTAEVHAGLRDTLTVLGDIAEGTVLRFTLDFRGSISPDFTSNGFGTLATGTLGSLTFGAQSVLGQRSFSHLLFTGNCTGVPGCTSGTSIDRRFLVDVPISNAARKVTFVFGLNAFALGEASADFGHTAGIGLELPTGLTFTSDSGVFLSAVPIPASLPLLSVALAGLSLRRRQRLN